MHDYQQKFIDFALRQGALGFGLFTLKSGRQSPYFFNVGLFDSGSALSELGTYYAEAIVQSGLDWDVLYGPAYKGIPLATTTAIALSRDHNIDKPWCFNRKEAKDHGEGGTLVGAPLNGRVLVIDDVITAGTAIGEAAALIDRQGATLAGVAIALDRQERGSGASSAIQDVEKRYGAPVFSVVSLQHIVRHLQVGGDHLEHLVALHEYRQAYGV